MAPSPSRSDNSYIAAVVEAYTSVPGTPGRASRQDRRLACTLEQQRLPLDTVLAAIVIGAARRVFRGSDKPPLAPVRTLAYFLPVIEEMQAQPPEPGYVAYVRGKLAALARPR